MYKRNLSLSLDRLELCKIFSEKYPVCCYNIKALCI